MLYIDGTFRDPVGGRTGPVLEKATGAEIGTYARGEAADGDLAVRAARAAQPGWAALGAPERAAYLRRFGAYLEAHYEDLVRQSMRETGGVRAKAEDQVGASIRQLQ